MSKTITQIGIGAAMVGGAFFTAGATFAGASALTSMLVSSGAGFVLSGVGTLLGQRASGIQTTSRNPLQPWQVVVGRVKVPGTIVYQEEVASDNRILLLVVAVACHACDDIEEVWINNRKVLFRLDSTYTDSSNPSGFYQSYSPSQRTLDILSVTRTGDVVTCTFASDPIGLLGNFNGDTLKISGTRDLANKSSMNGKFPVYQSGPNSFTYLCGGVEGDGTPNTGTVETTYADYGSTVTMGKYLGDQTEASGIVIGNTNGYWNDACILKGRTYVALKLQFDNARFNGMPELSFVVRGKNDIYDPRDGSYGYTDNAALCIADYLHNPTWGFGALYGSEIPEDRLISAANVCDEEVDLALGGTESRYTCNGYFDVSVSRGEVLQNMLTSCAGRLTYVGGEFVVHPGVWTGPVDAVDVSDGSTGVDMLINADGLVVDKYSAVGADSRTDTQPNSCGSSKSQFLMALGMLEAYKRTGNSTALGLAKLLISPVQSVLYQGASVPEVVDDADCWAPNNLFNVKEASLSSAIRYSDQFLVTGGTFVIPDTYGTVRKVYRSFSTDGALSYKEPYAPLSSGTEYAITGYSYSSGTGTTVVLQDDSYYGYLTAVYSCLSGDSIAPEENFASFPDWRTLSAGEIACSTDALNWAYRLFYAAGEVLEGGGNSNAGYGLTPYGNAEYGDPGVSVTGTYGLAGNATLQQAALAYELDDSRDWIKPSADLQPLSQSGSFSAGTAIPSLGCNSYGDITLAFRGSGSSGSYAIFGVSGLADAYNSADTTELQLGSTLAQTVTAYLDVVTGLSASYVGSQRYTATFSLAGNGVQSTFLVGANFANASGALLSAGTAVAAFGIRDSETRIHTLTIRRVRQMPDRSVPYLGGVIPYETRFSGKPSRMADWFGPVLTGFQSPWMFRQIGNEVNTATNVQFLADAQQAWQDLQLTADTVRVVIAGPNAQTLSVPVAVDRSGNATATFEYSGTAAGLDSLVAYLDSKGLSSNTAKVQWYSLPNSIAVASAVCKTTAADGTALYRSTRTSKVQATATLQGLMINTHPKSLLPGDPHDSGNQANPAVSNIVTSSGTYGGDQVISYTTSPYNLNLSGSLLVSQAGNITFNCYFNSAFVMGVGHGATYVSGEQSLGISKTPYMALTPLVGFNGSDRVWPGGNVVLKSFTLNFPKPGIYPYEIGFASGLYGEREFCLLAGSTVIRPLTTPAAPSVAAGSGQLVISPPGSGAYLGQAVKLTLMLSGLSYPVRPLGPFAPCYYFDRADTYSYGTKGRFGWSAPDVENPAWGVYQYRPLAELADLISVCDGTESYYSRANSVVDTFCDWIDSNWTDTTAGAPNAFAQTGATVTKPDPHCAALILHAVLVLDQHRRPAGTSSGSMSGTLQSLLNKCLAYLSHWYRSESPMRGTFCVDTTSKEWYSSAHGELLRSCSLLYSWASGANIAQASVAAEALVWVNGLVGMAADSQVNVDPDLGYTVTDLRGNVKWTSQPGRANRYNGIKGTYVSEANKWQQSDFPSYAQDKLHGYTDGSEAYDDDVAYEADGTRLWKDIQLPFTTSCSMAQRIAKIELMRIRKGRGALKGMMSTYKSTALDIVYLSFNPFGWTNKLVEVANHRLTFDKAQTSDGKDVTVIGTEMDIQETAATDYDWDISEELSPYGQSYISGLNNLSAD